jgi:hypothetical protein
LATPSLLRLSLRLSLRLLVEAMPSICDETAPVKGQGRQEQAREPRQSVGRSVGQVIGAGAGQE